MLKMRYFFEKKKSGFLSAGVSSSNDNSNVSKEPSDMNFDALKESYNRIKRK